MQRIHDNFGNIVIDNLCIFTQHDTTLDCVLVIPFTLDVDPLNATRLLEQLIFCTPTRNNQ